MTGTIEYGSLMHDAMRSLIRKVLEQVKKDGLPGAHHFFITFDTSHPDAELADWLSDRYPTEMTVVMQHWYDNLDITDDGFSITLNFGDNPEPLYVPFDAIKTFVDPSVEFGLRFEPNAAPEAEIGSVKTGIEPGDPVPFETEANDSASEDTPDPEDAPKGDADVVSLDSFRK